MGRQALSEGYSLSTGRETDSVSPVKIVSFLFMAGFWAVALPGARGEESLDLGKDEVVAFVGGTDLTKLFVYVSFERPESRN